MVDIDATEEVVRNAICLASTTFNVSKWIGQEHVEGSQVQRQRSNEMRPPPGEVRGPSPSSPRRAQVPQQGFEPVEVKEKAMQQQHQQSAVCITFERIARKPVFRVSDKV